MDKYHPGYFGKVGMRYFHKTQQQFHNNVINLDKLHTLVEGGMDVDGKVPVIDTLAKVRILRDEFRRAFANECHFFLQFLRTPVIFNRCTIQGFTKVLAKGRPAKPFVVRAKFVSRRAEEKIKKAGGQVVLVA